MKNSNAANALNIIPIEYTISWQPIKLYIFYLLYFYLLSFFLYISIYIFPYSYLYSACGPTICQIGRDNISRVSQFMILVKIVNFFKYSFLATCYGL